MAIESPPPGRCHANAAICPPTVPATKSAAQRHRPSRHSAQAPTSGSVTRFITTWYQPRVCTSSGVTNRHHSSGPDPRANNGTTPGTVYWTTAATVAMPAAAAVMIGTRT